jgi:hypothetical protein
MVTEAEAKAIMSHIGEPLLKFAASLVAPLYWVTRNREGKLHPRNGTAFFLRTKEALFGVTAAHVIEGSNSWRDHCAIYGETPLRLGAEEGLSLSLDWDARVIDLHRDIDLATFEVSPGEIEQIGRTQYSGVQAEWPPRSPRVQQGVLYAGFAGVGTRQLSPIALQFGVVTGMGIVSSLSDTTVSSLVEREHLAPALGEGIPPENFNFGGISGAPMLYATMRGGLLVNALAGIIVAGPNTSDDSEQAIQGFELIRARRTYFIREDGTLDGALWASLQP